MLMSFSVSLLRPACSQLVFVDVLYATASTAHCLNGARCQPEGALATKTHYCRLKTVIIATVNIPHFIRQQIMTPTLPSLKKEKKEKFICHEQ